MDNIDSNTFTLKIDSTQVDNIVIVGFSYEKSILSPETFYITLHKSYHGRLEDDFKYKFAQDCLGKEIEFSVDSRNNPSDKLTFKGIIINATSNYLSTALVAHSKDFVLNDAPSCRSYNDKSLEEIVNDVVKGRVSVKISASTEESILKKKIKYIVQYNETSYQFLARLAKQYGQFMYWDAEEEALLFGELSGTPEELIVLENISEDEYCSYGMTTRHPGLTYAGHDYLRHENNFFSSKGLSSNFTDEMLTNAEKASEDAFTSSQQYDFSKSYFDYSVDYDSIGDDDNKMDPLRTFVESHITGLNSQYVEYKGLTTKMPLSIGTVVQTEDTYIGAAGFTDGKHEPLVIVAVRHTWSATSVAYKASFVAYPKECKAPAYYDPWAYPKSGIQRAVVADNNDPEKLGRVKVQFLWQELIDTDNGKEKETTTPWIRITQPYAGTDRGFYVLPEIGDEVMVGFEQNNVERPFVMGGLYHGLIDPDDDKKTISQPHKSWTDDDNRPNNIIKGFRTNCGQTVEIFDEASNEGDGGGGNDSQEHTGKIHIYYDQEEKKNQDKDEQQDDNKAPKHIDYEITFSNGERTNKILVKGKTNDEYEEIEMKKLKIDISSNGSILIDTTENLILKGKNIIIAADDSVSITTDKFTVDEGHGAVTLNTGISIKKNEEGSSEVFVNAGAADKADAVSKIEMRGGKEEKDINIKVDVPSKIEMTSAAGYALKAKEITEETTDGDYTLTASAAITEKANGGDYTLTASAIKANTDGEFSLGAKQITEKANGNYAVEATSISEKANNDCKIEGTTLTVEGKTTADFKGGATTNVKGGIVNIN